MLITWLSVSPDLRISKSTLVTFIYLYLQTQLVAPPGVTTGTSWRPALRRTPFQHRRAHHLGAAAPSWHPPRGTLQSMPGSDFSLRPPPPPSTLSGRPLRPTPARCEPRVLAVHAGPHPFPVPARDRAGGEGRSISCPELAAGSAASSLQFSSAGLCGAEPAAAEQTEEREPGDPLTHAPEGWPRRHARRGGRGGAGGRARAEVGGAGAQGWAHRPPAFRMLPLPPVLPATTWRRSETPPFLGSSAPGRGQRWGVGAWSAGGDGRASLAPGSP